MDICTIIEFLSIVYAQNVSENKQLLISVCICVYNLNMCIDVMDKCKTENGKCSHYCSYDYTLLDFVCLCPSELTISENMKDCKRICKLLLFF